MFAGRGWEVWGFSRGETGRDGFVVTGPVLEIDRNSHLPERFDTVVNYIFLQGESLENNLEYLESLLRFCGAHGTRHLIHISSCSVYKNSARHIDEEAPVETDPSKKGSYGAIKLVGEGLLATKSPAELKISMIRPGLILGEGMGGYMGGIGLRMPFNQIVGLGSARSQLPVVSRVRMNEAICEIAQRPPAGSREVLLLAETNSPSRREYVNACATVLGSGRKVYFFPVPLWLGIAVLAEVGTRLVGKKLGIYAKVRTVCRFQRFDSSRSEKRVGMSFSLDWKRELGRSFEANEPNFAMPAVPELGAIRAKKITFVGFGRIVHQRHLPALQKLAFRGAIDAFDLKSASDPTGVIVRSIEGASPDSSDLLVVATPGPVHAQAIEFLSSASGPVLVEKPLCYSEEELESWLEFSRKRNGRVFVCHSSRFRSNVLAMFRHLSAYNSGRLHHVSVAFQSAPVAWDPALWLRDERRSRTLLMDYGIHPLDIACVFGGGTPRLKHCRHELNQKGQTSLIEGLAAFDNYSVDFVLRQGLLPRKLRILFTFQNYSVSLGFGPDTFVPQMTDDNFGLSLFEASGAFRSTVRKAVDYLRGRTSDASHAYAIAGAASGNAGLLPTVEAAAPFYRLMFEIADSVYGND
jgi:nucleoside-diphosphate-sugar epimerase